MHDTKSVPKTSKVVVDGGGIVFEVFNTGHMNFALGISGGAITIFLCIEPSRLNNYSLEDMHMLILCTRINIDSVKPIHVSKPHSMHAS